MFNVYKILFKSVSFISIPNFLIAFIIPEESIAS